MKNEANMRTLYRAVQERPRPEDAAHWVLQALEGEPVLFPDERILLRQAAARSAQAAGHAYSAMAADFVRPTASLMKSADAAAKLFDVPALRPEHDTPEAIVEYIRAVSPIIGKTYGESAAASKLTKKARRALGLFKNARWYNKRWRILCRMEKKIAALAANWRRYNLKRVAKSGLAHEIQFEDFADNLNTACFIAYAAAKQSVRSKFTNQGQHPWFDPIANVLLNRCKAVPGTRWDLIAMLMPDADVLSRIGDADRGRLLGRWWAQLVEAGDVLEQAHRAMAFDRNTMIVQPGNDSSTWNDAAGAWNKSREQWVSILHALGLGAQLDYLCPGKAMRLMASDVAAWHRRSGGGIHPATKVWAALPAPWDVVRGRARCTAAMVTEACTAADVDPREWLGPRTERALAPWRPTPELVHGVEVSSPELALALKKAGVFSGQTPSTVHPVPAHEQIRDATGAVLSAHLFGGSPVIVHAAPTQPARGAVSGAAQPKSAPAPDPRDIARRAAALEELRKKFGLALAPTGGAR